MEYDKYLLAITLTSTFKYGFYGKPTSQELEFASRMKRRIFRSWAPDDLELIFENNGTLLFQSSDINYLRQRVKLAKAWRYKSNIPTSESDLATLKRWLSPPENANFS